MVEEYISRGKLLELYVDGEFDTAEYHVPVPVIIQNIKDIPAADVRPVVKANWYWDKDGMDWNIGAWRCSACKAMSPMWWNTDRGSPMHKSGHNFCPNCGADMRPTSLSGANEEEN